MHTAEWKGSWLRVLIFNNQLVMIGDWAVVFAEDIIRWKRGFALRELGIWVVALQGVEGITVLIKSVSGVFVLVDENCRNHWAGPRNFTSKRFWTESLKVFSMELLRPT